MSIYILGIESSCDDTSAAVLRDDLLLSNVIANQEIHYKFGGVVPELASRAHQQSIIPVVDQAIWQAKLTPQQIQLVAFTQGPGLLGSLLVGVSFAKAFALALGIPMTGCDHMQAHILSHFIRKPGCKHRVPSFPSLCLTVSGGHTQIVQVDDSDKMKIMGRTIDDAAGETFDKAAKIMGLPYPGGPVIDRHARKGNPMAFSFAKPLIAGLDFSFSGLKTSFLYFLRDRLKENPSFISEYLDDLCASIQKSIVDILMEKLKKAVEITGITEVAIAGGVSANSGLREALIRAGQEGAWNVYIPEFAFTTDNAAMIAISGYLKYLKGDYSMQDAIPYARSRMQ